MAKTTYQVNENVPPTKDGSFKSCLCALLVFVAICVILLLAAWPWRSASSSQDKKEENIDPKEFEKLYDGVHTTNKAYTDETILPETVYPKTEKTLHTTRTPVLIETTTNQVQESITEKNEVKEEVNQVVTENVESGPDHIMMSTTLPYAYTKLTNEMKNIVTNITSTTLSTIETTYSRTVSDKNTTDMLTVATTTSNLIENILMSNISRTKGTHEAITDESTDPPQGDETDNFEPVETENLPSDETETTTTSSMPNSPSTTINYDNSSNQAEERLSRTTKPSLKEQNNNDTGNRSQKETIPVYKKHRPVCQDSDCKTTAARMLNRIKHSGDLCEDFYEYACGGNNFDNVAEDNWKRITLQLHEIKEDSPTYLQIFQKFYKNCVMFHTDYNYEQRVAAAMKKCFTEDVRRQPKNVYAVESGNGPRRINY